MFYLVGCFVVLCVSLDLFGASGSESDQRFYSALLPSSPASESLSASVSPPASVSPSASVSLPASVSPSASVFRSALITVTPRAPSIVCLLLCLCSETHQPRFRLEVLSQIEANCSNRQIVNLSQLITTTGNDDEATTTATTTTTTTTTNIVSLDLSNNRIRFVDAGSLDSFSSLQSLNLSRNLIYSLENGCLQTLKTLQILDLSSNRLASLDQTSFSGLIALKHLILGGNDVGVLPEGAFDVLPSLVMLETRSIALVCDCRIEWIVLRMKPSRVHLEDDSICAYPLHLLDRAVKTLTANELNCADLALPPDSSSAIDLDPPSEQIVFEGDTLNLTCRVSPLTSDPRVKVTWFRDGLPVSNMRTVIVDDRFGTNGSIESSILLDPISTADSGTWQCVGDLGFGRRVSRSVSVFVLAKVIRSCKPVVTTMPSGEEVLWPRTPAGVTRRLPCRPYSLSDLGKGHGQGQGRSFASHRCGDQGRWVQLDVRNCSRSDQPKANAKKAANCCAENLLIISVMKDFASDGKKMVSGSEAGLLQPNAYPEHLDELRENHINSDKIALVNSTSGDEGENLLHLHLVVDFVTSVLVVVLFVVLLTSFVLKTRFRGMRIVCHLANNVCTSLLLLSVVYLLCIRKVEPLLLCWTVVLLLQYFALTTFTWITLINRAILKTTSGDHLDGILKERSEVVWVEPPSSWATAVGWGLPAVIVVLAGSTQSSEMNEGQGDNGQRSHRSCCFPSLHLSIPSFFLPSVFLLAVNCVLWLKISRQIFWRKKRNTSRANSRQKQQQQQQQEQQQQQQRKSEQSVVLLSCPDADELLLQLSDNGVATDVTSSERRAIVSVAVLQLLFVAVVISGSGILLLRTTDRKLLVCSFAVFVCLFGVFGLTIFVKFEKMAFGAKNSRSNLQGQSSRSLEESQGRRDDSKVSENSERKVESKEKSKRNGFFSKRDQKKAAKIYWKKKRLTRIQQHLLDFHVADDTRQRTSADDHNNTELPPLCCSTSGNQRTDETTIQIHGRNDDTDDCVPSVTSCHRSSHSRVTDSPSSSHGIYSVSSNAGYSHPKFNSLNSLYDAQSSYSSRLRDFDDDDDVGLEPVSIDWYAVNEVPGSPQNSLNNSFKDTRSLTHSWRWRGGSACGGSEVESFHEFKDGSRSREDVSCKWSSHGSCVCCSVAAHGERMMLASCEHPLNSSQSGLFPVAGNYLALDLQRSNGRKRSSHLKVKPNFRVKGRRNRSRYPVSRTHEV